MRIVRRQWSRVRGHVLWAVVLSPISSMIFCRLSTFPTLSIPTRWRLIRNIFSKISPDIRHIFNGFLRSGCMLELELIGVSSSQLSESLYRGVQRHKSLLRLGVANPVQVWVSESSNLVPGLTGCLWILK